LKKEFVLYPVTLFDFAIDDNYSLYFINNPNLISFGELNSNFFATQSSSAFCQYTPPELLICTSLDPAPFSTWVLGILMANLLTRQPLIKPKIQSKYGYLKKIFQIVGDPNESQLMNWLNLSDHLFLKSFLNQKSQLYENLISLS
jgi:hypothetical protein